MLFKKKYTKNYLKVYENHESGEKFGLVAINGEMKTAILKNLQTNLAIQGQYVSSGGALSEFCVPTLLASGTGALGMAAATSGTLFMATANPATLMTIGSGVGSAVMGSTGIVAQAPFISVAGAIMPVVAPLMAFQALTTIMLMQQFSMVSEKLDKMQQDVSRILQRSEATFIGELVSASTRLDAIENEYKITLNFSDDMRMRLALVEDKVNSYFERYRYLYEIQHIDRSLKVETLKFKNIDAYMATLLSILDLQIDMLRIKLTLQENPAFVRTLVNGLSEKIEKYQALWTSIESNPKNVEELTQSLSESILAMNGWQKHMPRWLGGKREVRKATESTKEALIGSNTRSKTEYMVETARAAKDFGKSVTNSAQQVALLYWQDENGEHSYYTNDLVIK